MSNFVFLKQHDGQLLKVMSSDTGVIQQSGNGDDTSFEDISVTLPDMSASTILGQPIGGSGSPVSLTPAQAGKVISADTVSTDTLPSQTLTVSNLDGDSDGYYRIDFHLVAGPATGTTVTFMPNGVSTNQKAMCGDFLAGSVSRSDWALAKFGVSPMTFLTGETIDGTALLHAKSGKVRAFFLDSFADMTPGADDSFFLKGIWTDTSTNLTSFVVDGGQANAFAAGSYLMVTRLNTTN